MVDLSEKVSDHRLLYNGCLSLILDLRSHAPFHSIFWYRGQSRKT